MLVVDRAEESVSCDSFDRVCDGVGQPDENFAQFEILARNNSSRGV